MKWKMYSWNYCFLLHCVKSGFLQRSLTWVFSKWNAQAFLSKQLLETDPTPKTKWAPPRCHQGLHARPSRPHRDVHFSHWAMTQNIVAKYCKALEAVCWIYGISYVHTGVVFFSKQRVHAIKLLSRSWWINFYYNAGIHWKKHKSTSSNKFTRIFLL